MSQQVNLFDVRFRKQQRHLSARTTVQAGLAVLAFAFAFQQLYAYQNRSLQATLIQIEKRASDLREQAVRLAKDFTSQGRSAPLADEIARIEEQQRLRRGLLAGMQSGAGGDAQGFSPYLSALARQTMNGVWLTGIDVGAMSGELVLRGRVMDSTLVPAYIRQLRHEPPFADRVVSELRVAADGKQGQIEFALSIPLRTKDAF